MLRFYFLFTHYERKRFKKQPCFLPPQTSRHIVHKYRLILLNANLALATVWYIHNCNQYVVKNQEAEACHTHHAIVDPILYCYHIKCGRTIPRLAVKEHRFCAHSCDRNTRLRCLIRGANKNRKTLLRVAPGRSNPTILQFAKVYSYVNPDFACFSLCFDVKHIHRSFENGIC